MKACVFLTCATLTLASSSVWATLGQSPLPKTAQSTTSAQPKALLRATPQLPASAAYRVQELRLETGTLIQEYVAGNGVVFAVSWSGPVLPDFRQLLGNYHTAFENETQNARSMGRRGAPVALDNGDVVISSNGRMRNFFGHAYVQSLVPAGVNIRDVLP